MNRLGHYKFTFPLIATLVDKSRRQIRSRNLVTGGKAEELFETWPRWHYLKVTPHSCASNL